MPEIPWVEESASLAELVECICDTGEVERDVWSHVLDVKGDNLLLEDEKMLEEEEISVCLCGFAR